AILVPEHEVAFQILALNTEKAHNLKEKALEVIRMYRRLLEEAPSSGDEDYAFHFESPHFITLALIYEENNSFAGGSLPHRPTRAGPGRCACAGSLVSRRSATCVPSRSAGSSPRWCATSAPRSARWWPAPRSAGSTVPT